MSHDSIEVSDHINITDRGDDRATPNSGVSLYIKGGVLYAKQSDGSRTIPLGEVTVEGTLTVSA